MHTVTQPHTKQKDPAVYKGRSHSTTKERLLQCVSPRTLQLGRPAPICIAATPHHQRQPEAGSVAPDDLRQSNPVQALATPSGRSPCPQDVPHHMCFRLDDALHAGHHAREAADFPLEQRISARFKQANSAG